MYAIRELTGASYPMIGRYMGRDHTTVLHACKKLKAMPIVSDLMGQLNGRLDADALRRAG
jgi:hypothetical protein